MFLKASLHLFFLRHASLW